MGSVWGLELVRVGHLAWNGSLLEEHAGVVRARVFGRLLVNFSLSRNLVYFEFGI